MAKGKEKVVKGLESAKKIERHLEEIANNLATKNTMTHFINAGMEIVQAANASMKQMNVPPETKNHIHKAEKEVLLAIRSAVDVILAEIEKEMPREKAKDKGELKKIEIKRAKKSR